MKEISDTYIAILNLFQSIKPKFNYTLKLETISLANETVYLDCDCPNNDIYSSNVEPNNLAACEKLCLSITGCIGLAYNHETGGCYLKDKMLSCITDDRFITTSWISIGK